MKYPQTEEIKQLVDTANHILIIQADNPDADSLGSALALESILGDLGKKTSLYCAVDTPVYLRYMQGWDRIEKNIPNNFDLSIIVDASTLTLFEKFENPNVKGKLINKPCIVLDHHAVTDNPISFASVVINDSERASAGELIYILSKELGWSLSKPALDYITSTILGDTQGLSNELAKPETYRIMAELIEKGVNRPQLEEIRREYSKMPEVIFRYKAKLIERTEMHAENRIATIVIPQAEINDYSPLYNPVPLIQNDILQIKGLQVTIGFKQYDDGKITAAIRANSGYGIAGTLAEHMGGGGHKYASGFKITDGRSIDEIKTECIRYATELLDTIKQGQTNETLQYTVAEN